MADEDIATPVVSLDPPASDPVVETEKPVELENIPDIVDEETDTPTTDDETDELELGFKKYRVPKDLKTAVEDWRASTTQKEQSVAAERKALETQRLQQAEASDAELDARAQLKTVKSEMARFEAFDFAQYQQLRQTDPMGADEAWAYKQHLKDQHSGLEATINKATSERTELAQQDLAKRVQQTNEFAAKEIPGWKPEVTDKLIKYATERGVPEDVLKSNWSPEFYRILHEARIGSLALAKQAAAPKVPATTRSEPIAPLETVTAKSAPAHRPSLKELADRGDMDGYHAARARGQTR